MGKNFYWQCIKFAFTGGWGIADAVSFAIAAIAGIVVLVWKPLGDVTNVLVWAIPLAIFVGVVTVRLILAPYYLYKDQKDESTKLANKLNEAIDSQPNLVFCNCENITQHIPIGQAKSAVRTFASIYFANKPKYQNDSSIAKRVIGHVEFWDEKNAKLLFRMIGRWSDAKEPHKPDFTADDIPIEIEPNGLPRKLTVIFKYLDSDDCYGFNNDNHRFEKLCDIRKSLPLGRYMVKIVLKGNNCTSNEFCFLLENPNAPNEPILSPIKTVV